MLRELLAKKMDVPGLRELHRKLVVCVVVLVAFGCLVPVAFGGVWWFTWRFSSVLPGFAR